jgi:hypothetical protein
MVLGRNKTGQITSKFYQVLTFEITLKGWEGKQRCTVNGAVSRHDTVIVSKFPLFHAAFNSSGTNEQATY